MANRNPAVDEFLDSIEHPHKADVQLIREQILTSDPAISEQIKWKAPSFCFHGDDRVTFRFHPPKGVQLVFHRGVAVKDATGFSFTDDSGLMKWAAPDRATVTLESSEQIRITLPTLLKLVNRWMRETTNGPT